MQTLGTNVIQPKLGTIKTRAARRPGLRDAILKAYEDGVSYNQMQKDFRCAYTTIKKTIDRYGTHLPKRGSPGTNRPIRHQIKQLALEGKELSEIVAAVDTSKQSVSTVLTDLRRKGEIGMHDGRPRRITRTGLEGPMPIPELRLSLDYETRSLLDGEAIDLETTPANIARRILQSVLKDQELLEAALAAQEE